jgi:predicted ATPase/DNA-binding winged helix-turn-helix (wHTH) protein
MATAPTPDPPGPAAAPAVLAFGEFVLDAANARLTRGGQELALSNKPMALLAALAAQPGELVTREQLLDRVWRRRFVSDSAVKSVLSELRAALGDDARAPRWIETVAGRGYRFLGGVQPAAAPQPVRDPPPAPERGELPLPSSALIGREPELGALLALLAGGPGGAPARIVTLSGAAGVGKSALALAAAHARRAAHRDGAWWLDLSTLPPGADAARLRAAIGHTLRLAGASERDDTTLARSLLGLELLLVLDNAEHLLDTLAPVAAALRAQASGVQLLVTSREPLHLAGEQVLPLAPLSVPDDTEAADPQRCHEAPALRLFVERVRSRLPGFEPTPEQWPGLARLCAALDGLPLALELAAARVPALGLSGLLAQLAPARAEPGFDTSPQGLRLLDGSPRRGGTPEVRYRTLREALDWSHALLPEPEQRVLRRLAVFRAGFGVDAAQTVAADATLDDWAVLDAVQGLIDRSWLAATAEEPRRLNLLNGVRAYAAQRLADAGENAATRRRHFEAQLVSWRRADARALGDPALQWVKAHDATLPDLRAALVWGCEAVHRQPTANDEDPGQLDAAALLELAGASALVWHRAGHAEEGVRWCERVLAIAASAPLSAALDAARGGVDLAQAHLAAIAMVIPAAQGLAAARRAVRWAAARGDAVRENYALYLEHTLMARAEPAADRRRVLQRMAALQGPGWSPLLRRFERGARAYEARLAGRHADYLEFNRDELARCRDLGATWEAWSAGIGLMLAEHDSGQFAAAVATGRAVLDEMRSAGRLRQNANRLAMWTMMLAESGDVPATRPALAEALPIVQGAGRGGMLLLAAAWLAWHEGRAALAARLLARFDGPGRTGAEFGPGTFIRRSVASLWSTLRGGLSDGELAQWRERADDASEAEMLRELMGA